MLLVILVVNNCWHALQKRIAKVAKVGVIDTTRFVLKAQYNTDKLSIEMRLIRKYLKLVNLLKNHCNAKPTEIVGKIPIITGLATTCFLNAVEKKILNVSNLVKTDYYAKITDIKAKYFTTSDYNKFTGKILDTKRKENGLVYKCDICGFIDNTGVNKMMETLATKAEYNSKQELNLLLHLTIVLVIMN